MTKSMCGVKPGWVETSGDCDDTDASVHAGATEIGNGIDDDCDDALDEEVMQTVYPDQDGDGYGDANEAGYQDCVVGNGNSLVGGTATTQTR